MNLDQSQSGSVVVTPEAAVGTMKICIAGWYFREKFFNDVLATGYDAFVVKHREGDTQGIPSALYPNQGLEFGAYRSYVQNHWDGVSDVLFIHDDTEIVNPLAIMQAESLTGMGVDHAYIFRNAYEELCNGGAHGRAMWMRGSLIAEMKNDFPADLENDGVNISVKAQRGIILFHQRVIQYGSNTAVAAIIPGFDLGHRGKLNDTVLVFKRANHIPGAIINA